MLIEHCYPFRFTHQSIRSRQSRHALSVQIVQPNVPVVVRYANHAALRHGQLVDAGIGANRCQCGAHVAQLPHFDGAIVGTGNDLVVASEHRRRDGPAIDIVTSSHWKKRE